MSYYSGTNWGLNPEASKIEIHPEAHVVRHRKLNVEFSKPADLKRDERSKNFRSIHVDSLDYSADSSVDSAEYSEICNQRPGIAATQEYMNARQYGMQGVSNVFVGNELSSVQAKLVDASRIKYSSDCSSVSLDALAAETSVVTSEFSECSELSSSKGVCLKKPAKTTSCYQSAPTPSTHVFETSTKHGGVSMSLFETQFSENNKRLSDSKEALRLVILKIAALETEKKELMQAVEAYEEIDGGLRKLVKVESDKAALAESTQMKQRVDTAVCQSDSYGSRGTIHDSEYSRTSEVADQPEVPTALPGMQHATLPDVVTLKLKNSARTFVEPEVYFDVSKLFEGREFSRCSIDSSKSGSNRSVTSLSTDSNESLIEQAYQDFTTSRELHPEVSFSDALEEFLSIWVPRLIKNHAIDPQHFHKVYDFIGDQLKRLAASVVTIDSLQSSGEDSSVTKENMKRKSFEARKNISTPSDSVIHQSVKSCQPKQKERINRRHGDIVDESKKIKDKRRKEKKRSKKLSEVASTPSNNIRTELDSGMSSSMIMSRTGGTGKDVQLNSTNSSLESTSPCLKSDSASRISAYKSSDHEDYSMKPVSQVARPQTRHQNYEKQDTYSRNFNNPSMISNNNSTEENIAKNYGSSIGLPETQSHSMIQSDWLTDFSTIQFDITEPRYGRPRVYPSTDTSENNESFNASIPNNTLNALECLQDQTESVLPPTDESLFMSDLNRDILLRMGGQRNGTPCSRFKEESDSSSLLKEKSPFYEDESSSCIPSQDLQKASKSKPQVFEATLDRASSRKVTKPEAYSIANKLIEIECGYIYQTDFADRTLLTNTIESTPHLELKLHKKQSRKHNSIERSYTPILITESGITSTTKSEEKAFKNCTTIKQHGTISLAAQSKENGKSRHNEDSTVHPLDDPNALQHINDYQAYMAGKSFFGFGYSEKPTKQRFRPLPENKELKQAAKIMNSHMMPSKPSNSINKTSKLVGFETDDNDSVLKSFADYDEGEPSVLVTPCPTNRQPEKTSILKKKSSYCKDINFKYKQIESVSDRSFQEELDGIKKLMKTLEKRKFIYELSWGVSGRRHVVKHFEKLLRGLQSSHTILTDSRITEFLKVLVEIHELLTHCYGRIVNISEDVNEMLDFDAKQEPNEMKTKALCLRSMEITEEFGTLDRTMDEISKALNNMISKHKHQIPDLNRYCKFTSNVRESVEKYGSELQSMIAINKKAGNIQALSDKYMSSTVLSQKFNEPFFVPVLTTSLQQLLEAFGIVLGAREVIHETMRGLTVGSGAVWQTYKGFKKPTFPKP